MAPLTVLRLHTVDLMLIERQLRTKIRQQPQMFLHAPVLLDLGLLEQPGALAVAALVSLMRAFKLVPVGATNVPESMGAAIAATGLGLLQTSPVAKTRASAGNEGPYAREHAREDALDEEALTPPPVVEAAPPAVRVAAVAATPTPAPIAVPLAPALRGAHGGPMVIRNPVRSGQVVYAQNNDLVVLAPVNPGAQVMADGHVHIYAPLRGRAVAGAQGLPGARLFCQRMEAELVAIGDAYVTADEIPGNLRGRAVQVYLDAGECRIAPLG